MSKTQKTKEKWFLIWPYQDDDDMYEATYFDSYDEAKKSAEMFLADNEETNAVYYVAKATDKLCYEVKHEKF